MKVYSLNPLFLLDSEHALRDPALERRLGRDGMCASWCNKLKTSCNHVVNRKCYNGDRIIRHSLCFCVMHKNKKHHQ